LFARREASLWLDRFVCTTGDAAELFENVFHSPDPAAGLGSFNETGLRDAALDAAIAEALPLENLPRRRTALARIMRRLMHELVWIPLYTDAEVWAVRRSFAWRPRSDYWLRFAEVAPAGAGR
jgi:ABC-type oligopeptide transport system substrate-binding subunit